VEQAPAVITALTRFYHAAREAGETFPAFVSRIGRDRLSDVASGAASA
jgi:hypothetical protein